MLTGALHVPVVGGLGAPVPMPVHCVGQLAFQQVSMPLPSKTPLGCMASQAETQAATGSPPPLEPDEPLEPAEPDDPLEPDEPLEPWSPLVPEVPLLPPEEPLLRPDELEEVDPSPPDVLEQAAAKLEARAARTSETMRCGPMFRASGRQSSPLRAAGDPSAVPRKGDGAAAAAARCFVTYLAVRVRLCEP